MKYLVWIIVIIIIVVGVIWVWMSNAQSCQKCSPYREHQDLDIESW